MEEVDRGKYPGVKQRYRFELLQDMEYEEPAVLPELPGRKESDVLQTIPEFQISVLQISLFNLQI